MSAPSIAPRAPQIVYGAQRYSGEAHPCNSGGHTIAAFPDARRFT
jgi:hypothetical protein